MIINNHPLLLYDIIISIWIALYIINPKLYLIKIIMKIIQYYHVYYYDHSHHHLEQQYHDDNNNHYHNYNSSDTNSSLDNNFINQYCIITKPNLTELKAAIKLILQLPNYSCHEYEIYEISKKKKIILKPSPIYMLSHDIIHNNNNNNKHNHYNHNDNINNDHIHHNHYHNYDNHYFNNISKTRMHDFDQIDCETS